MEVELVKEVKIIPWNVLLSKDYEIYYIKDDSICLLPIVHCGHKELLGNLYVKYDNLVIADKHKYLNQMFVVENVYLENNNGYSKVKKSRLSSK